MVGVLYGLWKDWDGGRENTRVSSAPMLDRQPGGLRLCRKKKRGRGCNGNLRNGIGRRRKKTAADGEEGSGWEGGAWRKTRPPPQKRREKTGDDVCPLEGSSNLLSPRLE